MSRPQKVTALEVLDEINGNGRITKAELANKFDVCPETISNKLRTLREDDEPILFDQDGFFILNDIETIEDIDSLKKYNKWILHTMIGIAKCGKITKPLIQYNKEKLKELLSPKERKQLARYTAQVSNLLNYIEIEDELD